MSEPEQDATANPGFALGQMLKANSPEKALSWLRVLRGMLSGALRVGARAAIGGAPVWATPEVLRGGFVSGRLLAGGELLPREKEAGGRAALNAHYASEAGQAELRELLANGRYRVDFPEAGALLALAWLRQHGHEDEARALLSQLAPHFEELRFFPILADAPIKTNELVQLQPLETTIRQLRAARVGVEYERQRETLTVWIPLLDRSVALFAETVSDGWPCQVYASDWSTRARVLLSDFKSAGARHGMCRRPKRKTENLSRLIGYLGRCADDPRSLSGADVGMIRLIISRIEKKRGLPGTDRCAGVRARQADQLKNPQPWTLSDALADRLEKLPADAGSPPVDTLGETLPEKLESVVRRSREAPLATLLDEGVISSSEMLARVLPQLVGPIRSRRFEDPALRLLYAELYGSFRRRRSLLLLNYESQIKIDDLPWIKALEGRALGAGHDAAREMLAETVARTIDAFPHVMFPNKLLQEFSSLCEAAGMKLPIVEEIAADIFMGGFTEKYLLAAQSAGKLLEGTLYERYYSIPYRAILAIDDVSKAPSGPRSSPAFDELCRSRAAGPTDGGRRSTAGNGKIIEQSLVLTTHNLAVFFQALELGSRLDTEALARRCFDWICSRLEKPPKDGRLGLAKNAAYAWRQMLFFLAVTPNARLDWMREEMAKRKPEFQKRFAPALRGLTEDAPPFLGWTFGPHWALPPKEPL